ncbi:hypothetical protein CDL15_Pgr000868 [Punica granatum]|uniref:Uncharacterized protein n=1 Tax=Punica granatum TaxID=22663 RepID=A0A218XZV9_PUNGR|nr:hypothetical protein CDL15_Pgr000868 [Punica granatum]
MDKNDLLVLHTSCGLRILNGSGQIIYSNMILDQPSNTAQSSNVEDSSSSTVGKPSMPSKQFGIAYTTEEQRKRGTSRYRRELMYPFSLGQRVPPSFLFSLCLCITPEWVTVTLQQATTKPNPRHSFSRSSHSILEMVSQASQELRRTLIPNHMGYVGAHSLELESRRTRCRILANFQQVKVRLPKPVKLIFSKV